MSAYDAYAGTNNNNNPQGQGQGYGQGYGQGPSHGMYNNNNNNAGGGNNNNNNNFNINPEMLNFGLSAGQEMLAKQRERLLPGMNGLWGSLKLYFFVDHSYVLRKLLLILYPMRNKTWNRILADEFSSDGQEQYSRKWALPKQDINSPDLYIPLMAFVTYVLLCGLNTGMGTSIFTPELLVNTIWRCLFLQTIETGIIKLGVNALSVNLPILDVYAYTGYKYVGLCIGVAARFLGSFISIICSIYCAVALGYFILKALAAVVPASGAQNGPPRHILLLAFAGLQFLVTIVLSMM